MTVKSLIYKQDYIMRMINDFTRFLAKIFFNKDTVVYQLSPGENYTQTDCLHKQLLSMIQQGKINEAENLLFQHLDTGDKKYLELALDFYQKLNSLDDSFLEMNGFPREEIQQGLMAIAKEFGIPTFK